MMKRTWEWADLKELKGMTVAEAIDWLVAHGEKREGIEWDGDHTPLDVLLADEEAQEDCSLYLGGYWADEVPVIDFEDYTVVRWYREEAWD